MAHAWGSRFDDLGEVGHLNPASGFGAWPQAETYIAELAALRPRAEKMFALMTQRAATC